MATLSNHERTNTKFFVTLTAIMEGIYSDVSLNKDEMLFLDTWLLEIQSSIYFNEQAKYIFNLTKDFTETVLSFDGDLDKHNKNKFLERLEQIQDEIAEISDELIKLYYSDSELLINFLQGLCKGLVADGIIEREEIETLFNFLDDYSHCLYNEPMCRKFYDVLKDIDLSNLSGNQKALIKQLIVDFSGCDVDGGCVDGLSIGHSFFDKVDNLNLNGKVIQLTGRFKFGTRAKCKELAESQGAIVLDDWRMDIDYLIVGNLNSRDWIYQSYGRKIERAKEYQVCQGHKVKIITEEQWITP